MADPVHATSGAPRRPEGLARVLLSVVTVIVAVESAVFVRLGVLEVREATDDRMVSALGIAVLLLGYAIGQLIAVRMLWKGRPGARAPLIVTQLLQTLVATNLRAEPALAFAVAVPALVVLVILLSRPVSAVLADDDV